MSSTSTPVSLNLGLATTNTLVRKRYILIYLAIIWISATPTTLLALWFVWPIFSTGATLTWWFVVLLPLGLLGWWFVFVLCTIVVSRLFLGVVNLLHAPREGVFARAVEDKDYRYWSLRAMIRKFAIWVAHGFPLPYLDVLAFKVLGLHVKGGSALMDIFLDTEFVEIGESTILGLDCKIMSSLVVQDRLIIKRVKIGNNCLVGGGAVVNPGTTMGDYAVLGALSATKIDQELEAGWIYIGMPCRKLKENKLAKQMNYKTTELGFDEEGREKPAAGTGTKRSTRDEHAGTTTATATTTTGDEEGIA